MRKRVGIVLGLLSVSVSVGPAAADWRDQQWSDMDTGEMIGTDRANTPGAPYSTIPFVVNGTCSESSDRRRLSCYFVRLDFLSDPKTKDCSANVMVYRENLTTVERSPNGVVWTATGEPSRSGEVLTHRLQVMFKPNVPRFSGQPFQVDRWEYRVETFYPNKRELNSTAVAINPGKTSLIGTQFAAPCRPTAVGIQPFTSRRGAVIPE
jgi:hypothetical protein